MPEVCQNFNVPMYLNAFLCLYFNLLYAKDAILMVKYIFWGKLQIKFPCFSLGV